MPTERTLANGEVWELRGYAWHMTGYEPTSIPFDGDYAPVSVENFEEYAKCIEVGARSARQAISNGDRRFEVL